MNYIFIYYDENDVYELIKFVEQMGSHSFIPSTKNR